MANVRVNLYKVGTIVKYYEVHFLVGMSDSSDSSYLSDKYGVILNSTTYQDEFDLATTYTILPTDPKGQDKGETPDIVHQSSIFGYISQ